METPRTQRVTGFTGTLVCVGASFVLLTTCWLALLAVAPVVVGWQPYVITSASMAPRIQPGSIVVASPVGPDVRLGLGTVITYTNDVDRTVTHRIVDVVEDGYVTMGDANADLDSAVVPHADVRGTGRMLVPFVGLPIVWAHQGRWAPFLLTVGLLLVCAWIMVRSQRPAVPAAAPPRRRSARLRDAGTVLTLALVTLAANVSPPTSAAAFTSEDPTGSNQWAAAASFAPGLSAVTASDLPAHTASTGQTFTFTVNRDLAGGQTVTIELAAPHQASANYRGAAQPTASVGTAILTTHRGNSPQRTATITYTAPPEGVPHDTTVTLTIPSGIETDVPDSYMVPFLRSDAPGAPADGSFSVV